MESISIRYSDVRSELDFASFMIWVTQELLLFDKVGLVGIKDLHDHFVSDPDVSKGARQFEYPRQMVSKFIDLAENNLILDLYKDLDIGNLSQKIARGGPESPGYHELRTKRGLEIEAYENKVTKYIEMQMKSADNAELSNSYEEMKWQLN